MENIPSRVLIIDTAWLGDVLFSTALIGAVNSVWPNAEIQLLTSPRAEQLVADHPLLSRVWILDKQGNDRNFGAIRKYAAALNAETFDVVLCAHPSFRSRLLCMQLDVPIKVGYRGVLAGRAFTHLVHNDLGIEPDHVQRRLNLLRAIAPIVETPVLRVGIADDTVRWASNWLDEKNLTAKTLLAIIPGSARRTKQWDVKRFRKVVEEWISRSADRGALVFIGPSEKALIKDFNGLDPNLVCVVEEPLRNCAALLSSCVAAVGNDTGVSFLAVAAGCPKVFVLYGSTQVNYDFPAPHKALAAGVPCCLSRTGHGEARCKWTGGPPWCMGEISVERVLAELQK
ncbi:MAG: glycosyltransferase family 9 protein [Calditrichaeota bacterium]|nr:glycosyltransferase family 9 protein [Calditrichota bacterium]MCB9368033.1 glycosyltransferase family 9 protein [Calditrichota bacterium]